MKLRNPILGAVWRWVIKHVVLGAIVMVACTGVMTNPPQGPGTDFPCGYHAHSCVNTDHMCCPDHHTCGGGNFNGCPAGYCCYNGNDTYNGPGSSSRTVPQTKELP